MNELLFRLLRYLPRGLLILWCIAITVYGAKFVIPKWDRFTRFGKLEVRHRQLLSIPCKIVWVAFYTFSCAMFVVSWVVTYPPGIGNILLFVHSLRRALESLFVTNFGPRKIHIINFGAGMLFYVMGPLTLAYSCQRPSFVLPVVMRGVLVASVLILHALQFWAHRELASLRKYSIPEGFLFRKLTAPHYTIEVVCYLIYFLLTPNGLTCLMGLFVVFNLTHQAALTYDWYWRRFGEVWLDLKRYVLIPGVY